MQQKRDRNEVDTIEKIGIDYLEYLDLVCKSVMNQQVKIDSFINFIEQANAVHIYGFGRSGGAALSLAIRMRHFTDFIPPVWWVGDHVRMPICENDVVCLISGSGNRSEVANVAYEAMKKGAKLVLITGNENSRIAGLMHQTIVIPRSASTYFYGGGDFELAAYFLQELLVSYIGAKKNIPKNVIGKYHI